MDLPKQEKSFWREAYQDETYPKLTETLMVDVAIVGGGITGLTAAYLLKKSGYTVAVVEKDTVGGGTTGRTTGKVTSQHNLIYDDLSSRLGVKTARLYGEANQQAVELVDKIIRREKIDCGWQREDNYVYTSDPSQVRQFEREAQVAASIGLPASLVTDSPLPFEIRTAVKFENQAKIHAQQYVLGLAAAVNGGGSYVFEDSMAIGIRDGKPCRISTKEGKVTAKHIIVATNVPTMPLMARGAYCMLEYPTESYIVAGKLEKEIAGMYISPDDDNYSILPVDMAGERLLLIGGEGHISGVRLSKKKKFKKLAEYAEQRFGITELRYKWSDRDYLTYDGVPLAGKIYPWSKNLYVASAFRKWGLSNGTASAQIIHDLIVGKPNEQAGIFDPIRPGPIKNIPRVAAKYILRK